MQAAYLAYHRHTLDFRTKVAKLSADQISVLFCQDPHVRISLKGVMAHPWVTCSGSAALRTVR
jgi:hypothetical protein